MKHRSAPCLVGCVAGSGTSTAAASALERRYFCCAEGPVQERFQLHLITDRKRCSGDLADVVHRALRGGVDWIQVREKTAPALDTYVLAGRLQEACRLAAAGLIVNDRVDVALAIDARGVHLAKKSLPPAVVRRLLAPDQPSPALYAFLSALCGLAAEVRDYLEDDGEAQDFAQRHDTAP